MRRRGKRIQHGPVVLAVAARLHDDSTLDAEMRMQRRQCLLRSIFRGVTAVGRIRKNRAGPKYMTMRIAAARRQLELRFSPGREIADVSGHGREGPIAWRCRRARSPDPISGYLLACA